MKTNSLPKFLAVRNLRFITGVFSACIAAGSLAEVQGLASQQPASSAALPAAALPSAEPLDVDASLFTTQYFDWFDAQRQRQVPAKLYLPAGKAMSGSVPLVVFSHGIGGSRDGYSYLGRYFAAHGYGSLHVQHVGSDRQIWTGNPFALVARLSDAAQASEALQRVQDVRYSIDQMLASPQGALFDTRRIVAAGHSYGANTTMLVAGAQVEQQGRSVSLRDPRISAAIIISAPPFYGQGEPTAILSGIDVPTLHITATQDVIQIPGYTSGLQDRIDVFNAMGRDRAAPKVLAVFKDGSHSIFTDRAGTGGPLLNPKIKVATRQLALAFLNALPSGNYQAMDAWSRASVELIAQYERREPR
ncbi:alpha/beta hydrolase family protein [Rhodoferax sp.]|jgi:predicted dienelactone hydrolase|uniref:alpha/beta hydrolase family protein n=1 Tax=Rhodoferax sp. TaxID=50421 RepID=UPI003784C0D5